MSRLIVLASLAAVLLSCDASWIDHPWFAPQPPPYPNFADRTVIIAEAQRLSDALERYVGDWLDGKVPAQLPTALLPKGYDDSIINFRLVRPEEVTPDEQWAIRPAEPLDPSATRGYFPDPHATYLLLPVMYAPFGTQVLVEGQFPHARFFDLQPTAPFWPEAYRYNGYAGVGEVPLVDADIDPLPSHTNPFRVGADRNATSRGYQVTLVLKQGNPVELEPAFRPPAYRAPGNTRTAGGIAYQGPWGSDSQHGHGRGVWDFGQLWVRYYAPDKSQGALGGVPLPRVTYVRPDGRRYFLLADWSAFTARANRRGAAKETPAEEPSAAMGPSVGWSKQFGIFRAIVAGIARNTGLASRSYVAALDKGVTGRGEDLPAPGNLEPSATTCTYINYLLRGFALGPGKVLVLTGRLPSYPRTRLGEATMTSGQLRYFSITSYDPSWPEKDGFAGAALSSIMDDEIVTDAQGRYVIVYGRAAERPSNATAAAGVTWVDSGPTSKQSLTLRWLSVSPEWAFGQTPDEVKLPWRSDWSSLHYDAALVGANTQAGWLGEYQPLVHYLSRSDFERLGAPVEPQRVPLWQ